MCAAKASCSASLRTAKAAVSEAGGAVSYALSQLAESSESHAETAFHKTVKEYDLALHIPLTPLSFEGTEIPVLLFSDWFQVVLLLVCWHSISFVFLFC